MRKMIMKMTFLSIFLFAMAGIGYTAQEKAKVIILIAEQNISGPQKAWWASEIDLSLSEATIANKLNVEGFAVIEPNQLTETIKQDKAFRRLDISPDDSLKLAGLSEADYLILGKAVASAGSNVPQSQMKSYFANITAKLIKVKDGRVVAYLDAAGSTVHLDPVSGGSEALKKAAEEFSLKAIEALKKDLVGVDTSSPKQEG